MSKFIRLFLFLLDEFKSESREQYRLEDYFTIGNIHIGRLDSLHALDWWFANRSKVSKMLVALSW